MEFGQMTENRAIEVMFLIEVNIIAIHHSNVGMPGIPNDADILSWRPDSLDEREMLRTDSAIIAAESIPRGTKQSIVW
jgi:hypothetical protein